MTHSRQLQLGMLNRYLRHWRRWTEMGTAAQSGRLPNIQATRRPSSLPKPNGWCWLLFMGRIKWRRWHQRH